MLPDHPGSLAAAILLFPLVLWIPGMVLAQGFDVLGFRTRSVPVQIGLGLLLSMSVCPSVVYIVAREGGFKPVWIGFGILWIAAAIMALRGRAAIGGATRQLFTTYRFGLGIALCWIAFCMLWEMDFVTSSQVFRDLDSMDAIPHVAFTNAITRTGIPPINPFVYPGHPVILFYYYGWYMVCSLVDQLGGSFVTPRAAVQAGTAYLGLSIGALVIVFAEILGAKIFGGIRKLRTGLAIALFTITGLDVIPFAFLYLLKRFFNKGSGQGNSIEWWNEQVTAWAGAVLMAPHHPAAMVVCFTAALLFCGLMLPDVRLKQKFVLAGLMSLAMASAATISGYVLIAFSAGIGLWALYALRRGWFRPLLPLGAVAVLSGLLFAPYALDLRSASHEAQMPIFLTVRAFTPVDYWLPSLLHFLKHSPASVYALRFVLLPVNYFAELGFFLVAAVLYWRWRRSANKPLEPEESLLACLAAGSVLVCTFLTSTFRWNDLGWRGFLVAQFVMLLWATPVADALLSKAKGSPLLPDGWRRLVWFCLVIGAAGTLTEMINFRFNPDGLQGAQAVANRAAYIWVDQHTPNDTILLFNPDVYLDYFNTLYGYRQTVSAGQAVGTFYSTGPEAQTTMDEAIRFFGSDHSPEDVRDVSRRYHVGAIVVQATDPVWKDTSSWVWRTRPSYSNSLARVFAGNDIP
jgi:hypothetical protein